MPHKLLCYPLSSSNLPQTVGVWNDIGMVAYTIDDWSLAESIQPFTRKFRTGITMVDIMYFNTVTKSVFTLTATLSDII